MNTNIGSVLGDLTAHRKLAVQRAEARAATPAASLEIELDRLVDQVVDEDVEAYLIERTIDAATSVTDPLDEDYDGDELDAFSAHRQDAIDALFAVVDRQAPLAIHGLVMALAWALLDRTDEGEFLTILEEVRAQLHSENEALATLRVDWPET
jgi:hypothetical protein